MSRILIETDLAGVLVDVELHKRNILHEMGLEFPSDLSCSRANIVELGYIPASEWVGFADHCYGTTTFSRAPAMPGALEALARWTNDPDIAYFVATSRPKKYEAGEALWFEANGFPVPDIRSLGKELGRMQMSKGAVGCLYEADILFDNLLQNIRSARGRIPFPVLVSEFENPDYITIPSLAFSGDVLASAQASPRNYAP